MIGVIVAAPSVAMILTTVPIGRRVDALGEPRRAIVALNAGVLALNAALLLAAGAWQILVLWTLGGVLMHAVAPAADALALGVTRRRGTDWARLRMFGSLGFVLAVTTGGALFERAGIEAFLGVLIAMSVARLLAAAALPDARARVSLDAVLSPSPAVGTDGGAPTAAARETGPEGPASASGTSDAADAPGTAGAAGATGDGGLHRAGILLTLGGAALINASHALFYTFGLLIWTRAGIGETLGGLLWSAGVLAEMALMWRFGSIARRLSARGCLLLAAAAGVLRWSLAAAEPPLALLFAAQLLHALTFGLVFVAGATFIHRRVGDAHAARGQSLMATLAAGSMAAATWGAGLLFERLGASAYVVMASLCAAGAALVAASYRTRLDEPPDGASRSSATRSASR